MISSERRQAKQYINNTGIVLLGLYFAVVGFLLIQNLYSIWPSSQTLAIKPYTFLNGVDTVVLKQRYTRISDMLDAADEVEQSDVTDNAKSALDSLADGANILYRDLHGLREELSALRDGVQQIHTAKFRLFIGIGQEMTLSKEEILFLIVVLLGALGSWLHATSSFLHFTGNRTFVTSWTVWYIMRPIMGAILALIFYVVIRAGFFPSNTMDVSEINIYSIAATAGLVGLFTQRATKKLADVFDAIFPTSKMDKDPLNVLTPEIQNIIPSYARLDESDQEFIVEGKDFNENSRVFVNKKLYETNFSEGKLRFILKDSDVKEEGTLWITVRNIEKNEDVESDPWKLAVKSNLTTPDEPTDEQLEK